MIKLASFNDAIDVGYFILYRYDRGYWNIPRWHFARCYEEVTEQLFAEYRGWA